jgi:FAD/FMN-containing dehydrogenase
MAHVQISMPLIGRDAGLVAGWAEAAGAVAVAYPRAVFTQFAAVRVGDEPAADACEQAGVSVVTVPWYDVAGGQVASERHNYDGVLAKRTKLIEAAAAAGTTVIWYIDADVRVRPEDWGALGALLAAGHPVAIIPYPIRWADNRPVVCLSAANGELVLYDARALRADDGSSSVTVAGGGFGCTAVELAVGGAIPFKVHECGLSTGGFMCGEDIGWFFNARDAGVAIRMPLGFVAEHVGCLSPPMNL